LECVFRIDPGISRGLEPKSSFERTSISAGHRGVPTKRASLSPEIELMADTLRPCVTRDAILQHVASWGDRNPHGW
jgi:hypothetical protein